MLKEIEFSEMQGKIVKDSTATFYLVMREIPAHIKFNMTIECPELAPSEKLANDYRLELISEADFVRKYKDEMKSPICQALIWNILRESEEIDIYLVSANEDRLFLLKTMDNLKEESLNRM